ncbi:MAG: hypothetical protein JSU92_15160 [Deltaproteobacteria bacterium]|nr:MAG: hypothetical protein JSU92_15160 [Deltaproteobacteria bacterium]
MDKRWLILLLFILLLGISFGCGKEIGVRPNQPPIIESFLPESLAPIINEGNSLRFSVIAYDPEGEGLSYCWILDVKEVSVTTEYLFSSRVGDYKMKYLKVIISDGELSVTKSWRITINVPPHVASILSPQEGNRYDPATAIGFAGEAEDFEQGSLNGASLVWSSDIDGQIGVGTAIASQLSLGLHTITLTATDNNCAQNSASITLEIRDDLWKQFNYANHIGGSAIENTFDGEYIWVGTKGGVVRWDIENGTYTKYTTADGLCNNVVRAVAIDSEGNKWFGSGDRWELGDKTKYGNGVCKYDGTTWTNYNFSKGDLVGDNVNAVAVDKQGRLWFGTYNSGVSVFDGETWTVYGIGELPHNRVNSIAVDSPGNVWIGGRYGLTKYDGTNWTIYTDADGWPLAEVYTVGIDPDDNVWVGAVPVIEIPSGDLVAGGVSVLSGTSWTTYTTENSDLSDNGVVAIDFDTAGNAWLGAGDTLCKFDGVSWTNHATSGSIIFTISVDSNDDIWFGSGNIFGIEPGFQREGLAKYDGITSTLYWAEELGGNEASVVEIQANGNIWFGTYDGGLSEFDGSDWTTYTMWNSSLGDWAIQDIARDNSGIWWIAAEEGATWVFDGIDYWFMAEAGGNANAIAVDMNGNVWLGTIAGLKLGVRKYIDGDYIGLPIFYNTSNSGLIDDEVFDIAVSTDYLWFLTPIGISRFDGVTGWVSYSTRQEAIEGNYAEIMTTINENTLWTVDNNNVWIEVGGEYKKYNGSGWTIYPDIIAAVEGDYTDLLSTKYLSEFWKIDGKDNIWVNVPGGAVKYDGIAWTTYYPPEEGGLKVIDLNDNKWFGGFGIWRYTVD